MLSVYICEDDQAFRGNMQNIVTGIIRDKQLEAELVSATDNPDEIMKQLSRHPKKGLYFLDVELHKKSDGLYLAGKIRERDRRASIVFVTEHEKYMRDTFKYKLEVMDYIEKSEQDLNSRIYACLRSAYAKFSDSLEAGEYRFRTEDSREVSLGYDQILYIRTRGGWSHQVTVCAQTGRYMAYGSLTASEKAMLEQNGPCTPFFRCHTNYLVNMRNVKGFDEKRKGVVMKNGEICQVSSRKEREIKKQIQEICEEKAGPLDYIQQNSR